MNALTSVLFRCWVVIVDETGPIGHSYPLSDPAWKTMAPEVLLQLAKAAHPGLNIVSAKWAERPRDYTISDPVLLVSIPGTHELARPVFKVKRRREPERRPLRDHATAADVADRFDANDWRGDSGSRGILARDAVAVIPGVKAPAPELDAVAVINTCPTCGTAHTAATWARLEVVATKDFTEGSTAIHEDYRRCTCGSTRMIFSTRLVSE